MLLVDTLMTLAAPRNSTSEDSYLSSVRNSLVPCLIYPAELGVGPVSVLASELSLGLVPAVILSPALLPRDRTPALVVWPEGGLRTDPAFPAFLEACLDCAGRSILGLVLVEDREACDQLEVPE